MFRRDSVDRLSDSVCLFACLFFSRQICHCHSPLKWSDSDLSRSYVGDWGLVCQDKALVPLLNSLLFLGWIPGAVVFGYLADKNGRRPTVLILSWCNLAVLTARALPFLSPNYAVFAVLVFIQGFIIGKRKSRVRRGRLTLCIYVCIIYIFLFLLLLPFLSFLF